MKKIVLFCVFLFLIVACSDEQVNDLINKVEKQAVMISKAKYETEKTSSFEFVNLYIEEDLLFVKFRASGCDGTSWKTQLIDLGKLQESSPPIRNVRFVLDDKESCEAYLDKEVSFDLKSLRVEGIHEIYLKIQGFENKILYKY